MPNPQGKNQYTGTARKAAARGVAKVSKMLDQRNAQIKSITKLSPSQVSSIKARTSKMAATRRKMT